MSSLTNPWTPTLPVENTEVLGKPTGKGVPKLFHPLVIRGITIKNRIWVSPMCQYSSHFNGLPNNWHLMNIGSFATKGAGLACMEATAVSPNGRITPQCLGIWSDEHTIAFKGIVDFMKSQGCTPAIQLAHAGRKASSLSPFYFEKQTNHNALADESHGGWPNDVVAPSAIPYSSSSGQPSALTIQQINKLKGDFVMAAKRANDAGFDVIELHAAHGYLLHEFLSPITNKRTDEYGGSLENRCRLLLEIVQELRSPKSFWPDYKPIFVRISSTDGLEHLSEESWTLEDSIQLCKWLKDVGCDLIDCSSGGLDSRQQFKLGPGYQVPYASTIRSSTSILTAAVGMILTGTQAKDIIENDEADGVFIAREFLRDSALVLRWAQEVGIDVEWPVQYGRAKRAFKI